jgi:HEAT repeat protein
MAEMTKYFPHTLLCAAALALTPGLTARAGSPKDPGASSVPGKARQPDESKIIAGLSSSDPRAVLNALDDVQEQQHPGTNALAAARKLLGDPRPSVRKKAARVLGELHAPVDKDDLSAICRMLKSYDPSEADDALKALRGLNARETVPEITPLLKNSHPLLIRDACRTLAVLGNKDLITLIEPLLHHPIADVKTDAQAAIAALRDKP